MPDCILRVAVHPAAMFAMRIAAFSILLATCAGSVAAAERYPERPIRLVVPTGAGGNTDVSGRSC
jgi:tripartite-type tricarboxylate transporter receptor subunit TctC